MCCILGLLLCAKTKLAKAQLAAYFAEGATNAGKSRYKTTLFHNSKKNSCYFFILFKIFIGMKQIFAKRGKFQSSIEH
jgi:hypothetical protein